MKFTLSDHAKKRLFRACILILGVSIAIWVLFLYYYHENKLSKIAFGSVCIILIIELDIGVSVLKRIYPEAIISLRKKFYSILNSLGMFLYRLWENGKRGKVFLGSICMIIILILALPMEKYYILLTWKHRSVIRIINKGPYSLNRYLVYVNFDSRDLVGKGMMNADGSDVAVFTHDYKTVKHIIQTETVNTEKTLVCFKANVPPNGVTEYLMFFGKPKAVKPVYSFGDTNYHFQTGRTGDNIQSWRRDTLERDGSIIPVYGRFMQKVTVTVKPVPGNHATNEQILFPQPFDKSIFHDSYLEYDIRAAQDSFMRATAALAFDDGTYNWNDPAVDTAGYSSNWRTDINDLIHNKWHHRRIPLFRNQEKRVKSVCFMMNDYPDLKDNGTYIFYFDNMRVVRGPAPVTDIIHEY